MSGALEPAPIAPPLCRPRPPACLHYPLAPSGMAPSPLAPFRFSAVPGRFTASAYLPSIYKRLLALSISCRRTFSSLFSLLPPFLFFFLALTVSCAFGFQPDALPLSFYRRCRSIRRRGRSDQRGLQCYPVAQEQKHCGDLAIHRIALFCVNTSFSKEVYEAI